MEDKWLTAEEVAQIYGVKVTTVWEWARKGKIPAYHKRGTRLYEFRESELPPARVKA